MKKILTAAITAGIAITIWQFAAWMIIPLHKDTIKFTPEEETITAVLENSIQEEGVYGLPNRPPSMENPVDVNKYQNKFRQGPLVTIFYRPTGSDPLMISMLITGFIINIIASFIAAWLLSRSTAASQSYIARVCFVGVLGIFASIVSHIAFWNWMFFPLKYTTAMMADMIIAWIVAGMVIAAIIKSPKT